MVQAAGLDGQFFDPIPPFDDGGIAAKVGIGGRDVAEALVVAVVVIVIDESADLAFKVSGQVIVFQQDAVFQGLVPTLDLALCLGMIGGLHGHASCRGLRASPQDRRRCKTSHCH